jgi:hypothetical protein
MKLTSDQSNTANAVMTIGEIDAMDEISTVYTMPAILKICTAMATLAIFAPS